MFKKQIIAGALLLPAVLLTSCVDNGYDLSDIDTTTRVSVENLVVPINLDAITLKSMFDLDEEDDGCIKIIDGQYCVVKEGSFTSDNIKINKVIINSPNIPSTSNHISTGISATSETIPERVELDFGTDVTSFSESTKNVSTSIVSIKKVGLTSKIRIIFSIAELAEKISNFEVREMNLQLPKGLVISSDKGSYDTTTGMFKADRLVSKGNKLTIELDLTGATTGNNSALKFSGTEHKVDFNGSINITSAKLVLEKSHLNGNIPSSLTLETSYKINDVEIKTFSGEMQYDINGASLSTVNMNDLPDVLSQPGTDISIYNPQIYLRLNNPLGDYKVHATSGMYITAYRGTTPSGPYKLDNNGIFTIEGVPVYEMYLAPHKVEKFYPGYTSPFHVPYTSLGKILSGDGLPTSLEINLDNPQMPVQQVENLPVGVSLGEVNGHYDFFAPLSLSPKSKITYSDDFDDWDEEELDNMTIENLSITATVTTDFPVSFEFKGYPIDRNGNIINNVEIVGANVPAKASGHPIEIHITGAVTGIDGIRFQAVATAGDQIDTLSPAMNINIKNIRAKVSGYYEKEL